MHQRARIKRAIENPRLLARGVNRLYHRRLGRRPENPAGVDVFSEDWDTLIVLDACRYDMYEENCNIKGALSVKQSKGSSTPEWLRANFAGRDLRDTVYVTANPQLERNRARWNVNLHNTTNVWLDEGWDENTGTVLAETVNEAALRAHERFPSKRIVVHYMQPHYPFIQSDTQFDKDHLSSIEGSDDEVDQENVWNQKFLGRLNISRKKLWSMYCENLEYVLEHVGDLLDNISGKVIVTSDHGNFVGEPASPIPIREWGHPRGIYDDPVIRIPWFEIDQSGRRDIDDGSLEQKDSVNEEIISERLEYLGYR